MFVDIIHHGNMNIENCEEKPMVTDDDVAKRGMSIPELGKHIISFLPLDSVKACRLVCRNWNSVAGPLMIKISQIRFRNLLDDPEQARFPDKFIEEFHTGSLLYKCDKFCFNSPENWIEYDDMFSFIEQFAVTMKELTIFGTYIRNALYELSMDHLVELIPTRLTKLEIVTDRVKTKLIISIDRLKHIKTLRLGGCILKMIDGAVCAPVELRLKNIYFLGNLKHFPKSVKLNDVFDFRNLKDDLHIDCSETENVELDVSVGSLKLKTWNLERVTIHN